MVVYRINLSTLLFVLHRVSSCQYQHDWRPIRRLHIYIYIYNKHKKVQVYNLSIKKQVFRSIFILDFTNPSVLLSFIFHVFFINSFKVTILINNETHSKFQLRYIFVSLFIPIDRKKKMVIYYHICCFFLPVINILNYKFRPRFLYHKKNERDNRYCLYYFIYSNLQLFINLTH
jgi:hypothetical protein